MNNEQKESILKAAQNEKYSGKEIEKHNFNKSVIISELFTLIVASILFIIEYCTKHTKNIGLLAVAMAAVSVQLLFEGLKGRIVFKIILGFIDAIIALFLIIGYIVQVVI